VRPWYIYIQREGLDQVNKKLDQLLKQGAAMAKKFDEVSADLDATKAAVDELIKEVGLLVANGPGVVTQAQLDELDAKIQAIGAAASAADPNPGT
jgi:hypothetical protein